jgi:hypothetical protein
MSAMYPGSRSAAEHEAIDAVMRLVNLTYLLLAVLGLIVYGLAIDALSCYDRGCICVLPTGCSRRKVLYECKAD